MKAFFAFLFLIYLAQWPLQGEDSSVTPIVVQIDRESLLRPTINGKSMSILEVKRFLQDSADRFGTKDPVIIQLDQDQGIEIAVTLLIIAHQSHDDVFLGLRSFYIAIPKDGIKPVVRPTNVNVNPVYIPRTDYSPNLRGEEQIRRLLNIQQNKIE